MPSRQPDTPIPKPKAKPKPKPKVVVELSASARAGTVLPSTAAFDPSAHAIDPAEERLALLRLVFAQTGHGALPNHRLLRAYRSVGGAAALLARDAEGLARTAGFEPDAARRFLDVVQDHAVAQAAEREAKLLREGPEELAGYLDADYPPVLRYAKDPPLAVWIRGRYRPRDAVAVAILGASRPEAGSGDLTRAFAGGCATRGLTIVNGGERGVDTHGIEAALDAGGRVAVALGTGLRGHGRNLDRLDAKHEASESEGGGVLLSTVPLETTPNTVNQVAGDRLVIDLSLALVVARSHANGGALIAVRLAQDVGRPVLALPGDPGVADTQGSNGLLVTGRATIALDADDAIEAAAQTGQRLHTLAAHRQWLAPRTAPPHPLGPADPHDRTLLQTLDRLGEPTPLQALAELTDLPATLIEPRLTRLRVMGWVGYQRQSQRYMLRWA